MEQKLSCKNITVLNEALNRADKSNDVKTKCDADGKYIRTPWKLCEEIVGQIATQSPLQGKKILVVDTVEFIPVLLAFGAEKCNITYVAPYEYKGAMIAGVIGVRVVQQSLLEWKPDMKFDVVVGNPPYQEQHATGGIQPTSHNLWGKFIEKSNEIVSASGFISFVTPDSWMSANSKVLSFFKENTLIWCNSDASEYFREGSSFTAWVVKKEKNCGNSYIDGMAIDLIKELYIPRDFQKSYPIHKKVTGIPCPKIAVKFDTACHSSTSMKKVAKEQSAEYPFKIFHTNAQIRYGKVQQKHFDKKKLVWTLSGYFKPFYDNGSIGTTEISPYVLVGTEDEAKSMISYLTSKLFMFIIFYTGKWSGFTNGKVFESLPKLPGEKIWTDAELYTYFGLTQEEIDYIEATVK